MLGLAQGAFDKAVPFTYERKQFGQAVGTFQGMAFQIAQAAIELESARLLLYNATRRKEEGLSFVKEAAMAKYWTSVVAQRVSGQAIEWAGGVGFTRETGIEKFWRDSKIVSFNYQRKRARVFNALNLGRYIRRDVQHSTTDHRKDYPEGIFIESRVGHHSTFEHVF
jgi:alkylation response protein AidB-like acyl-CoA dehydrogenase